jgi:phospholipase C
MQGDGARAGLTRRQVLAQAGALAASGSVLGRLAPPAAARRPAARQRSLWDIDHIVVMMQENRSFDHLFGTLAGVRGFSDPHAISSGGRSVFDQELAGAPSSHLFPYRLGSPTSSAQGLFGPAGLVNQSWDQSHLAWDGGRMDKWTSGATAPWAMGYLARGDLPFDYAVADAFTVCDAYHCSVLGPTDPNRLMLFTGTIDPLGRAGGPVIDNSHESGTLSWTTFPERLQAAGVSWRVYHESDDFGDNDLRYFTQYLRAPTSSPLYQNALVNRGADAFADDAARGRLPQVSWIVAPANQSEHPGFGSIAAGEDYVSRQLRAVMSNPRVWARTAFLFCYDEHGGFFDHVPPPVPRPGTALEFVAGAPIGLGFRVPMVICSPFTRGRRVCHQTFDHTSIIRLIERRFGVHEPNISAWRRAICGDLTSAFDFAHPDYEIPSLPSTAPLVAAAQQDCRKPLPQTPPPVTSRPSQEPGSRQAVQFATPRPGLIVAVSPARVRAGCRSILEVRVTGPERHQPLPGALVRIAGHHARTDRHGVARIAVSPARRGHRYAVTAGLRGYTRGEATVVAA